MAREDEILSLILARDGKTAADLTHALGVVGNGRMADGIVNIADYAARTGMAFGRRQGFKRGVFLSALVVFGIAGIAKLVCNAKEEEEEQRISWKRVEQDAYASSSTFEVDETAQKEAAQNEPNQEQEDGDEYG